MSQNKLLLLQRYKYEILLGVCILVYIVFFCWLTILRHETLNSHYYDLGIMDQTVYNTSQGRFLELTSKDALENIKRMSIHNDVLLAAMAPFYYIYKGPETLLVLQTVISALGALGLYLLAYKVLKSKTISIVISLCYLLYSPLELANNFDFHIVTFATTFLIFAFYFAYIKKYIFASIFIVLSLLTKENVALTTILFGIYMLLSMMQQVAREKGIPTRAQLASTGGKGHSGQNLLQFLNRFFSLLSYVRNDKNCRKTLCFGLFIIAISLIWFILSIWFIIPANRDVGDTAHFAVERYGDFGDSPTKIIEGVITKPQTYLKYIFNLDTGKYLFSLFSPTAFLSIFAIPILIIVSPEFAINILSSDSNMRNIIYHYTAIITPFIFISTIFGIYYLHKKYRIKLLYLGLLIFITSIWAASISSPLPFSKQAEQITPLSKQESQELSYWEKRLAADDIVVTATGHLAPHFTDRRIFYLFSSRYQASDYVVMRGRELDSYPDKTYNMKVYKDLTKDKHFQLIYKKEDFEVYKRISSKK